MDGATYSQHLRPLLAQAGTYARSLLRNNSDAADAVQLAALRGWERIGQFDSSRSFRGWWFAILRNCCLDMLRTRHTRRTEPLDSVDAISESTTERVDLRSLEAALARLSDAHREILRLKYFGDLKYDEIADALNIPVAP